MIGSSSTDAVTIDMVYVGNAGNAADTRYIPTGIARVDYEYQIGKYVAFLTIGGA